MPSSPVSWTRTRAVGCAGVSGVLSTGKALHGVEEDWTRRKNRVTSEESERYQTEEAPVGARAKPGWA